MKKLLVIFCVFFSLITLVKAEDLTLNALSAILIDSSSGEVLYEKNADEKLAPASMTKIMTMLLIMEAIDNGNITFDDEVTITKEAASMGGSQVFLKEGEVYKVSELLKGIAVASGNDAAVAMAERIGGSVEGFVNMMNEKAKALNLSNTNFVNPHGLDVENHYSSARDMAIMAKELLKHEKILEYSSIYEEYLTKNDGSKTWLVNTNKLIKFYNGADGLKTGFTKSAGYCLTATAKKNDLRLISVVMKEDSTNARTEDTVKMLNYGFNTYKLNVIKDSNEILGRIKVVGGKKDYAEIVLKNPATKLLKISEQSQDYTFNILIDEIKAPIKKGDVIGTAQILDTDGNVVTNVDLTVKEDILKANFWDYIKRNLKISLSGKIVVKN